MLLLNASTRVPPLHTYGCQHFLCLLQICFFGRSTLCNRIITMCSLYFQGLKLCIYEYAEPQTEPHNVTYNKLVRVDDEKKSAEHEPSRLRNHSGRSIYAGFSTKHKQIWGDVWTTVSGNLAIRWTRYNLCILDDDYCSANHFEFRVSFTTVEITLIKLI